MKRSLTALFVLGSFALLSAQGKDAAEVLADARQALGGTQLESLKSLSGKGRTLRSTPRGDTVETEFEVAFELPDKYRLRTALMPMGNMTIYREIGFNAGRLIEQVDRPPNLSGGMVHIRVAGPGGPVDPEKMTPEQKAEFERQRVLANKKEYARLALGLFAASPGFPLEFAYAGEAEAPDGKADVIDVKGPGDFAARLFVDQATHLPLMLSWMDKEPLTIRMGPGGPSWTAGGGGGGTVVQRLEQRSGPMSKEEREKLEKEMEEARAKAEADRRTVEFRVYYADYREVGGVRLPHRIQRSIDGKAAEEMEFDSLKVNAKIDARTFEPTK
ncbi:MAG TPA: hypothetical protein PKK95_09285 [Vicinamibacterales bacterium]|nr:hypothetical protein [Acidobacteriota bacterium]HOC18449.1 hypothetical protein [Vicinamibacterales bacterium]